jgi:xanthine/CO dehydrogenase XdhC/CoxF family maturation factor
MRSLREFYLQHQQQAAPLVLATVVSTLGSTYRKSGAQMLIDGAGDSAGLLSGGCLESDLAERACAVLASGTACVVEYDTRTSDDLIWGLGLGCEGAMRILLQHLAAAADYQPFTYIQRCRDEQRAGCYGLVYESRSAAYPLGHAVWAEAAANLPAALQHALSTGLQSAARAGTHTAQVVGLEAATFLVIPIEIAPRLLILGAGPDATPIVEFAARLGWHVTVLDHRPAYAVAARFPQAQRVALNPADALTGAAELSHFDAVIVMSHHLLSDLAYLRQLADAPPRYIGLLGPAARRARLLADLGPRAQQLAGHLYGPAGLDIGANTPESIALAIISQIQAVLADRSGGSFAR